VAKTGHGFSDFIEVPDSDGAREHLLMNLRLAEGLDLAAYQARWGTRPDGVRIAELVGQDLLSLDGEILRATPRGRILLNAVIAALLN
jgi:oxygen-independent coproporphyrinogen-3 oxidase